MKHVLHLFLALILVGAVGTAFADDDEELRVYDMDEMVVTGSKMPKTPGNVTQKIEIIPSARFEELVIGNSNLAEILSYSPGNFANVLSRNDANWGSTGGLAHTYKGYMLDGLPVDAFIDLQSLDPAAFERIEDQRGSASVLYPTYLAMDFAGNQSPLAGTTNFVLKERVAQPRTTLSTYYGSYNTIGGRFFHQRSAGDLHVFFGGHHEDSDYTDYGTEGSWLNMVDDPEYEKTKMYMRATYFLDDYTDHKVSAYIHRTWHTGDTGRPNRDFNHMYTTVNASYLAPASDKLTIQAKIGYRDYDRLWEDDKYDASAPAPDFSLSSENGVNQEFIPGDVSFSLAYAENSLLTAGADFQAASYETFSETDQKEPVLGNDADATHYGAYAQVEHGLDNLVLRAGVRYNHLAHDIHLLQGAPPGDDTNSWDKILWSAGARYNPSNLLSLYTNAGSSFKAPSLKSVGGTIPLSSLGDSTSGHLPSPDIEPEAGISLDVGGNYRASTDVRVGARGFYILIDDQIVQRVAAYAQSQDINAGKTTTLGLEAELRHRISDTVEWFANYTFTDTEIENPEDPDKDGASINFVPQNMLNVGANIALPQDLRLNVTLQYLSSTNQDISNANPNELDGYALVNAKIEKTFLTQDGYAVRLYVEPYNLLNNDFEMAWGFKDPGFSVNGGVAVTF